MNVPNVATVAGFLDLPPGGLLAVCAAIEPSELAVPTRSLRNSIARELLDGRPVTWTGMRRALDDARLAITMANSWWDVFGAQHLLDAIDREHR